MSDRRLSYKPTGEVLLHQLRRHVMREASRVDVDRDMSYLHPSEMAKPTWCARVPYYRISGAESSGPASIGFQLANVFAEGHSIHDKYQKWLWDMGVLWGQWECKTCGVRFFDLAPMFCECGGDLRYKEVPLFSGEHLITGKADGAVLCEDGKVRLIEIKTVGVGTVRMEAPELHGKYADASSKSIDQLWYSINRPFPSHLRQGQLYLALAPQCHSYLADVDEIVFLYEWKPTQAVKEYVVKSRADVVEGLLSDAVAVRRSLEVEEPPDRPDWSASEGPVCKKCEYSAVCWGKEAADAPATPTVRVKSATRQRRRKALGSA
jgi:hypothetical protein